ncbi:MAG: phosphoribosylanthranilate isomerase [Bacteroidaceae bacterium]|nr:phosphoribosylanthranilate isomerase [Bacteroidaceae bacterium]
MIVKVCGMRDADNIRAVEQLGVDWMGFILYKRSPRFVASPPAYMPCRAKRVGVTVGMPVSQVVQAQKLFGFDIIQLHGNENPNYCMSLQHMLPLGVQIIKKISVGSVRNLSDLDAYVRHVDYFLFEPSTLAHGGSGTKFDWTLLSHYHNSTPFILAGGIGPEDIEALHRFTHPQWAGIDLNSRFETKPALKDVDTLRQFIHCLQTDNL